MMLMILAFCFKKILILIILGETSSGKSTIINKILGKTIFSPRTLESTSTICKIRNFKKVQVIIEYSSGEILRKRLNNCDSETVDGVQKLRTTLDKLTDLTVSKEGKECDCVDIGFPIPILKVRNLRGFFSKEFN